MQFTCHVNQLIAAWSEDFVGKAGEDEFACSRVYEQSLRQDTLRDAKDILR